MANYILLVGGGKGMVREFLSFKKTIVVAKSIAEQQSEV